MNAVVQKKNCCVCGIDVSRMRRTKDPRGKYYCRPCYDTLWEAHQQRVRKQAARGARAIPEAADQADVPDEPPDEPLALAAAASGINADLDPIADLVTVAGPVEAPASPSSSEFQITALPASSDDAEPVQRAFSIGRALSRAASALSALRAPDESGEVVHVSARRVKRRRIPRDALRLSDLVGDEAHEAVQAARVDPRHHEAEVPVSPITNPPVSALVDDYAALVEPGERIRPNDEDDDDRDDNDGVLRGALFSNMSVSSAAAS